MNGIEVEIITPPVADDDDPLDAGLDVNEVIAECLASLETAS